jgi:hypothetical protein
MCRPDLRCSNLNSASMRLCGYMMDKLRTLSRQDTGEIISQGLMISIEDLLVPYKVPWQTYPAFIAEYLAMYFVNMELIEIYVSA